LERYLEAKEFCNKIKLENLFSGSAAMVKFDFSRAVEVNEEKKEYFLQEFAY
jgi:hypothetical protein